MFFQTKLFEERFFADENDESWKLERISGTEFSNSNKETGVLIKQLGRFKEQFKDELPLTQVYIAVVTIETYTVCHEFRLTKPDDCFWVTFDHFWSKRHLFEVAGVVPKSMTHYVYWTPR